MEFNSNNYNNIKKSQVCSYIHSETGKRCCLKLGLYTDFCELHTMMVDNVYIKKSNIEKAGMGLFAGPYGFKKGDIIGKYSYPWDKIKLKNKCKNNECWKYVFCQDKKDNSHCWLGFDIKGSIILNIQPIYERKGKIGDASTSRFNINSVFQIKNKEIYVLATSNIKPNKEIFASYKI